MIDMIILLLVDRGSLSTNHELASQNSSSSKKYSPPSQAYLLWMVGNVKFEQQNWQEALDAFGQSQ